MRLSAVKQRVSGASACSRINQFALPAASCYCQKSLTSCCVRSDISVWRHRTLAQILGNRSRSVVLSAIRLTPMSIYLSSCTYTTHLQHNPHSHQQCTPHCYNISQYSKWDQDTWAQALSMKPTLFSAPHSWRLMLTKSPGSRAGKNWAKSASKTVQIRSTEPLIHAV